MPAYENISVERTDGVATITFDNTDQRNALDIETTDELLTAATRLGDDSDVRCIVLTHTGEFYGTGADLTALSGDASDAPYIRRLASRIHEAVVQFHQAPKPVVGGIDGIAAGAGFSLALVPDLLVLSEDARLEFAYPRIGLTGDGGATFLLPRLVGLRTAKELVLLDEPIYPERAVELGLATEVVPSDTFSDRLTELARDIASGPTHALGQTMRLLTESFDRSLESQLAMETDVIADAIQTTDFERGYEAFFEGNEPTFVGR